LLAHVPPAVINKAVELGEEHPAFDWEDGHAAAVHDAAVFNTCVDTAGNVGEGVLCLGSLLTELPEAMVERSVRITSELPPPNQPAEEPQMLSKDFVYCLEIAETRDAATYCLAHFLGRLPDEQVSCSSCDDTRECLPAGHPLPSTRRLTLCDDTLLCRCTKRICTPNHTAEGAGRFLPSLSKRTRT
jgi:hypothetical protein